MALYHQITPRYVRSEPPVNSTALDADYDPNIPGAPSRILRTDPAHAADSVLIYVREAIYRNTNLCPGNPRSICSPGASGYL